MTTEPTDTAPKTTDPARAVPRVVTCTRRTRETDGRLRLDVDGEGRVDVSTGIGFLDHMLSSLAFHAGFDLTLSLTGDAHVDDHHSAEDSAILLGQALREVRGDGRGLARFGEAHAPLDEALARAVIDLSGRPWPEVRLELRRERIGGLATENITHVFNTLAIEARLALHLDVLRGENDHHKAEAAFKATALALRRALAPRSAGGDVPSLKGSLSP